MRRLLIVFAVATSGCGTFTNITPCTIPPHHFEPYGGVRNACFLARSVVKEGVKSESEDQKRSFESALVDVPPIAMGVYFSVIDAPLSVVADTVTLPIVLKFQHDLKVVSNGHIK